LLLKALRVQVAPAPSAVVGTGCVGTGLNEGCRFLCLELPFVSALARRAGRECYFAESPTLGPGAEGADEDARESTALAATPADAGSIVGGWGERALP